MSDFSISIVPRISRFEHKEEKAKDIIDWLISQDIIEAELSKCIHSLDKLGYAISAGAKKVVIEPETIPFGLLKMGLEVILERHLFGTWQYGLEKLICLNCKQDIANEDWGYFNEWVSGESDNLTCPRCAVGNDIHTFQFDPAWGFSDLGFKFCSWNEFKPEFLEEFKNRLGVDIDVVYARI